MAVLRPLKVVLTNLDAGDYVFNARAANSDGVWSETGLSLALRVAPAPWETPWAYAMYAAVALLLLLAAVLSTVVGALRWIRRNR